MSSEPGDSSRSGFFRHKRRGGASAFGLIAAPILPSVYVAVRLAAQAQVPPEMIIEVALGMLGALALSAAFSAGEAGLSLLRKSDSQGREDPRVRAMWDARQRYASACELGSHASLVLTVLLAIVPAYSLQPTVEGWGLPAGPPALLAATLLVAVPLGAVHLVFGKVVPKTLAANDPVATVARLSGFIKAAAAVGQPFVQLALGIGGLVTKRFGARATLNVANKVEDQIKAILAEARDIREMDEERTMIHSVFEFGDTVAREVMTPRVRVDSVPLGTPLDEVARRVDKSGHSRIPVFQGTDDHIVGVVHAKDVLRVMLNAEKHTLADILRPAFFVPENKGLHELLQEMRQNKTQIVVVQDEFGATSGIVTVEDIVEEVVGEIVDEYDDEQPDVVAIEGGFLAFGKTNLYDLNEVAGTGFESEEYDTIGGYVFGLFGRQPRQGDEVEDGSYRFVVDGTDGRHIERLRIVPLQGSSLTLGES